jgi:hypothetical protein
VFVGIAMVLPSWALASCVLGGFDRGEAPVTVVEDAGPDADVDVPDVPDADPGCAHVTFPPPPDGATPGGDIELVVAVRAIDMGEDPEAEARGLDLDGRCTCDGDERSCGAPPGAPEELSCDFAGGVDNAAKRLMTLLSGFLSGFSSEGFSSSAEEGTWSALFRVKDYNGEPDDAEVRFEWLIAGSFGGVPAWDGDDSWPVSSANFASGPPYDVDNPIWIDANAYVSGGKLVAALPEVGMQFGGTSARMFVRMVGGILVAELSTVDIGGSPRWYMPDALIAARWPLESIFDSVGSFRDENGMGLCTDELLYSLGRDEICRSADISSVIGTETTPCDSVSLSLAFSTFPAQVGPVYEPIALNPFCPPGLDPSEDDCAN